MSLRLPILPDPRSAAPMTWVQLVRTHSKMARRIEQFLDRRGLTLPQWDVLATLSVEENITQQELAGRLLVTKGNVCGVLDRMETAGLVIRRADDDDKRINRLALTPKGRKLFIKLLPDYGDIVQHAMRLVPKTDIMKLFQLLDQFEQGLEPDTAAPA